MTTTGPQASERPAVAYDSVRQQTVLVVALNPGNELQPGRQFWTYDGTAWVLRSPLNPASAPRLIANSAMAFDANRGQLVLFGGSGVQGGQWVYEQLTYENAGGAWSTPAGVPAQAPRRTRHSMVYDSVRQAVILFGGEGQTHSLLGDTWVYPPLTWQSLSTTGPSPRIDSAMAFDSVRNKVVLFGGRDNTTSLGDTWELSGSTWTQVFPSGPVPSARSMHSMVFDSTRGKVILFGGWTVTGAIVGDTWEFDGTRWTQVALAGPAPSARYNHQMVYDSARQRVVLMGGYGQADTWEFRR